MSARKKKGNKVVDGEVMPPECALPAVVIDANHLRVVALDYRRKTVPVLMPRILASMKKDAAMGLMHSVVFLDLEQWRAMALLEEIAHQLQRLGFQTQAGMAPVQGVWDTSQKPCLQVSWQAAAVQ